METKKVLVTGGTGFIGRWISKELIKNGYDVYIIDDLSGSTVDNIQEFSDDVSFYNVDLSDTNKTYKVIDKIRPEMVYHLASSAREGASFFDPVKITKTNYMSYINILESCIRTGCLDKIILFSSMAVYGEQKVPFSEDMRRIPVDIYGQNKAIMEETTRLLSNVHEFRYTILNPHNVYGPFQSMKDKYRNVIMIMNNKILRKESLIIYGDGEQRRAFSYIEDSLPCYIKAMEEKCDGERINIGGKIPITINKLAELIKMYMGISKDYPVEHLQDRFGEVKHAFCTIDKSEKLLGYKEDIGYKEGIKRTVEWAIDQGPKEWTIDKLALWNSKAPKWWS